MSDRHLQRSPIVRMCSELSELHPAYVADILESLPQEERMLVWHLAVPEEDGEVLLEVSDAVRESLIGMMDQEEMLAVDIAPGGALAGHRVRRQGIPSSYYR